MNCISNKLKLIKNWLDFQHYDLTAGIKSVSDAEKLYDYFRTHPELCDGCDYQMRQEWEDEVMSEDPKAKPLAWHVKKAIGYDPLGD